MKNTLCVAFGLALLFFSVGQAEESLAEAIGPPCSKAVRGTSRGMSPRVG